MSHKYTFTEYYSQFLSKSDLQKLEEIIKTNPKKGARINSSVFSKEEFLDFAKKNDLKIEQVPWCPNGYFCDYEAGLGKYQEFEDGMYYPQDAASMIPPELLNPAEGETVLDMCASPGGKTIHLSNLMNQTGIIIANEVEKSRLILLNKQLAKYGVYNEIVTSYDSSYFARFFPNYFDKILLDAPCSGEGMRARGGDLIQNFNFSTINFNFKRQKRIINNAFQSLKKDGMMVYSTCALSYEENEGVINYLLKKYPDIARLKKTSFKKNLGISKDNQELKKCIRVLPFHYNTNGFFICLIKKLENTPVDESVPHSSPARTEWYSLRRKEEEILKSKLKKALGCEISIPRKFHLVKFKEEIWLQPEKLLHFRIPYISYAGIKIGKYSHENELKLENSPLLLKRIFNTKS